MAETLSLGKKHGCEIILVHTRNAAEPAKNAGDGHRGPSAGAHSLAGGGFPRVFRGHPDDDCDDVADHFRNGRHPDQTRFRFRAAKQPCAGEPRGGTERAAAVLTVTAGSKKEVLADRANLTAAMQRVFAQEGSELYDIGTAPHASPVPNAQTMLIHRTCIGAASWYCSRAWFLMANRLLRSGLPPAAMIAIVAASGGAALLLFGGALIWLALLPVFLLALMTIVTFRMKRAGHWVQGEAQITSSKVVVKRHQFAGEPTKVTNHAAVRSGSGDFRWMWFTR